MTILVHLDVEAAGNFGMIKEVKQPDQIEYDMKMFMIEKSQEALTTNIDLRFSTNNAIVVFENDKLVIETSTRDEF